MNLNLFQITIMLGALLLTFLLWYKYRSPSISNFFIGGGILILLYNLDFLDLKPFSKYDAIIIVFIIFSYFILNLSSLFIYLFKNKKQNYFIFPIIVYLLISIYLLFFVHTYGYWYYEKKIGILIRLFLAFFPLYTYTYYKKFTPRSAKSPDFEAHIKRKKK